MNKPPENTFQTLSTVLSERDVSFQVTEHEPVFTSEQAAAIRGTTLASGAKALICKVGKEFRMLVMPADRKLNSRKVRAELGSKKLRFASPEEVLEMTGLKPGSIPPFGSLFGLPTTCDTRLANQTQINFNAGDHGISISMAFVDYVAVEAPGLLDISDAAGDS